MAKFSKNGEFVEISNLGNDEIIALLKIDVHCTFVFVGTEIKIELFERGEKNGKNSIKIMTDMEKTPDSVEYSLLIEMITKYLQEGILVVRIKKNIFKEKEPLLLMLENLKKDIIHSCMLIDYDHVYHIYSVINRKLKNGCSDKLYYFEDNNSILAFGKNGPVVIYGETSSIEDLICD